MICALCYGSSCYHADWGERSFGWMARFGRPARDYERLPETLAEPHFLAFVILMLKNVAWALA